MTLNIVNKNSISDTGGVADAPLPTDLEYGELAINYVSADPAIFVKDSANTIRRVTEGVGTVSEIKIASNAVTNTKLASNCVTEAKILNGAVTSDKIAGSSVTEGKILNGAVTGQKIASNTITNSNISSSAAIDGTKINPLFTANSTLNIGLPTGNAGINVGASTTANRTVTVDLSGDSTYPDYGLRMYRNGGPNGTTGFLTRGTGNFDFDTTEGGQIVFRRGGVLKGYFASGIDRFILQGTGSRGATGYVVTSSNDSVADPTNVGGNPGYIQWVTTSGVVGTTWFASDINLKENIAPCSVTASEFINSIEFKEFDWKPDSGSIGHVEVGVIAQQLEVIEPSWVYTLSDGKKGVNEPAFMTYMAKSLQEALGRITDLEAQVAALQNP
jgi:hypothetical protein